jgi:hypothetical protein
MLAGLLRCAGCRYCMKLGGQKKADPTTKLYRCESPPGRHRCPRRVSVRRMEMEPLVECRFFELLEGSALGRRPMPQEMRAAEALLDEAEDELDRRLEASRAGRRGDGEPKLERRRRAVDVARMDLARLAWAVTLPDPATLRRDWAGMATIDRRRHLAMAVDVIFLRDMPGATLEERVVLVPFGHGPRDLPRTGVRMPFKPYRWPSAKERRSWC